MFVCVVRILAVTVAVVEIMINWGWIPLLSVYELENLYVSLQFETS